MGYFQNVVLFLSAYMSSCYANCGYQKQWSEGVFQIADDSYPVTRSLVGLTVFECLAACFVIGPDQCSNFNFWKVTNTSMSKCDFFSGPIDEDIKRNVSEHAIHAVLSRMPSEMRDVVGMCSGVEFSCVLNRFGIPTPDGSSRIGANDVDAAYTY